MAANMMPDELLQPIPISSRDSVGFIEVVRVCHG